MCREITAKNVQKQWSKFNLRPKRLRQPRARCIPDAAHAPTRITDHAHPTRTHTRTHTPGPMIPKLLKSRWRNHEAAGGKCTPHTEQQRRAPRGRGAGQAGGHPVADPVADTLRGQRAGWHPRAPRPLALSRGGRASRQWSGGAGLRGDGGVRW